MVPLDPLDFGGPSNRWQVLGELVGSAKGVSFSGDEQRGYIDITEVFCAELLGLTGRMQRVTQQYQAPNVETFASRDRTRATTKGSPPYNYARSRYPELLSQTLRRLDDLRHGTRHAGSAQG